MPTIDDLDEFDDEKPERIAAHECFSCGDEIDKPILCKCHETICADCIEDHQEACDA